MSLPSIVRSRRRAAVVAAAGVLLSAAVVAVPAADANALTCRQNQKFRISATVTDYHYSEVYTGGGKPSRTGEKRWNSSGGYTEIVATTCKSGKTWKLISPIAMTPFFNGLNINGRTVGMESGYVRGMGSPLAQWTRKDVKLRTFVCYKGEVFTGLKAVLGIPFPVKTPIAVAAYVVGYLLPEDGMHCDDIITMSVPLAINARGYIGLRATTNSGAIYRSSTPLGDIKLVNEWWVTYKAVRI